MAAQNSTPSDLYKCVYSFLLENKFTKAAQQFLKQTKVVSGSPDVVVNLIDALPVSEVVDTARGAPRYVCGVHKAPCRPVLARVILGAHAKAVF